MTSTSLLMQKRFAALANFSFGSVNVGLTMVAGFLLVPWYLRHIDLATYGAWLASGGIISAIAILESGLSAVLTRRLATAHAAVNGAEFARLSSAGIGLATIVGCAVAGIGLAISPFVPAWVHVPSAQTAALARAVQLAAVGVGLSVIFTNLGAITQAWQQTIAPGVIGTTAFLTSVVVIVVGLEIGWGVVALGAGRLALGLTYNAGYIAYIGFHWRRKALVMAPPSFTTALDIWRESRKLLVAQVANTLGSNIEPFVVAAVISPKAAAVVSLTGKLITTARMFVEHVGSAAFAGITIARQRMDTDAYQRIVIELLTVSIALSGIGIGCAIGISPALIPKWVGTAAFGGAGLMLLIAASDVVSFRKAIMTWLLLSAGETEWVARTSTLEAVFRPLALVGAVLLLGVYGVPIAGILAGGIPLALLAWRARDALPLPLKAQLRAGAASFGAATSTSLLWLGLVPRTDSWMTLGAQSALLFVLIATASLAADRRWRDSLFLNLRQLQVRKNRKVVSSV